MVNTGLKKTGQQVARQLGQLPGEILEKAAEQAGVVPRREGVESTKEDETKKELVQKATASKKASLKRAAAIQAEINQLVQERQMARQQAQQREELAKKEEKMTKKAKPPAEAKGKKPRGLLLGVRQRQKKAQAETVGRRVSG